MNKWHMDALQHVRTETDQAKVVGCDFFAKGQLPAGIGWGTLEDLEKAGFVEFSSKSPNRQIRITDLGRKQLD